MSGMKRSVQDFNSVAVAFLIGVMPLLMLTEIGHASSAWYVLVVLCLTICLTREGGVNRTLSELRPYRWVIAAFMFSLVPVVLNMLRFQSLPGAEFERALRMILGCVLVLGATLSMQPKYLRRVSWGFMIAGLISCAYVFWPAARDIDRPVTPEYNAVTYGNLMLLLSMLVMYSTRWALTSWPHVEKVVKWVVVLTMIIGFILTQTRTGWLALPVFILIWLLLNNYVKRPLRLVAALALLVAICAGSLMLIPKMNERATDAYVEISECAIKNPLAFSSVCIRMQLWRSSLDMFYEHPLLGLGRRSDFQPALIARVEKGLVLQYVADDWAEPHSDMLMILATQGLFGGIALLLVYFAPAVVFARRLVSGESMNIRTAAAMGLAICIGFAIFGLTELMFRGMRTIGFYSVMIGWLLALSDRHSQLRN